MRRQANILSVALLKDLGTGKVEELQRVFKCIEDIMLGFYTLNGNDIRRNQENLKSAAKFLVNRILLLGLFYPYCTEVIVPTKHKKCNPPTPGLSTCAYLFDKFWKR